MTQRDNILQELNELGSQLAGSTPQNTYAVPPGYFEGLELLVMNRIKAIEAASAVEELSHLSPVLSGLSKQMPYRVPAGYFESLGERIMKAVRESSDYLTVSEETASLSPLLAGLKKETPYTVPAGYFENLATGATIKGSKQEAKVISLSSRKWFRYAAAAVVVGVILMAGFLVIDRGEKKQAGEIALSKVTKDVKKLNDTQKDELIDFLDAGMDGKETVQVKPDNKSKEIQQLLQDVSEEELKDFQEQTEDIEEVLMTN